MQTSEETPNPLASRFKKWCPTKRSTTRRHAWSKPIGVWTAYVIPWKTSCFRVPTESLTPARDWSESHLPRTYVTRKRKMTGKDLNHHREWRHPRQHHHLQLKANDSNDITHIPSTNVVIRPAALTINKAIQSRNTFQNAAINEGYCAYRLSPRSFRIQRRIRRKIQHFWCSKVAILSSNGWS